jgi:hypothetical protein
MTEPKIRIGLIGDYNPAAKAHQAIPRALALAACAYGDEVFGYKPSLADRELDISVALRRKCRRRENRLTANRRGRLHSVIDGARCRAENVTECIEGKRIRRRQSAHQRPGRLRMKILGHLDDPPDRRAIAPSRSHHGMSLPSLRTFGRRDTFTRLSAASQRSAAT